MEIIPADYWLILCNLMLTDPLLTQLASYDSTYSVDVFLSYSASFSLTHPSWLNSVFNPWGF